jgi:mono/diheme cytochrome c family protein
MFGRIAAAAAVTATVAPAAFLPPPLFSESPEQPPVSVQQRFITQVGMGGLQLYNDNCALCHGWGGNGTEYGPALTKRIYWRDRIPRRKFHATLTGAHHADLRGSASGPKLGKIHFNHVELIARYVHEIQRPDMFR